MTRKAVKVANPTASNVARNGTIAKSPAAREVESRIISLAEQVGWFVGTVQYKADEMMDNETLKQQLTMLRDGASAVLEQVNRAGSAATESAARIASAAKAAMPGVPSKRAVAAKKAAVEKQAAAEAKRMQSRAAASAPGKRHMKPPPQEKVQRGMAAPAQQRMGQKSIRSQQRRGQADR